MNMIVQHFYPVLWVRTWFRRLRAQSLISSDSLKQLMKKCVAAKYGFSYLKDNLIALHNILTSPAKSKIYMLVSQMTKSK